MPQAHRSCREHAGNMQQGTTSSALACTARAGPCPCPRPPTCRPQWWCGPRRAAPRRWPPPPPAPCGTQRHHHRKVREPPQAARTPHFPLPLRGSPLQDQRARSPWGHPGPRPHACRSPHRTPGAGSAPSPVHPAHPPAPPPAAATHHLPAPSVLPPQHQPPIHAARPNCPSAPTARPLLPPRPPHLLTSPHPAPPRPAPPAAPAPPRPAPPRPAPPAPPVDVTRPCPAPPRPPHLLKSTAVRSSRMASE